jgi:hypothetical protein
MFESQRAVNPNMIYLVLAASEQRALLLKSDSLQFLVTLTDDLHFISARE